MHGQFKGALKDIFNRDTLVTAGQMAVMFGTVTLVCGIIRRIVKA